MPRLTAEALGRTREPCAPGECVFIWRHDVYSLYRAGFFCRQCGRRIEDRGG